MYVSLSRTQSDIELTIRVNIQDFNLSSPSSGLSPPVLRIFNSPSNTHDLSKHLACSLATNPHCYFQDDDWFNPYLDTMFTKYLECCSGGRDGEGSGARIVTGTIPWIAWEQRKWRVENHRTTSLSLTQTLFGRLGL